LPDYDLIINHGLCNLCEDCVEECPENVLERDQSGEKILAARAENCNNCGVCMEACMLAAIVGCGIL